MSCTVTLQMEYSMRYAVESVSGRCCHEDCKMAVLQLPVCGCWYYQLMQTLSVCLYSFYQSVLALFRPLEELSMQSNAQVGYAAMRIAVWLFCNSQ